LYPPVFLLSRIIPPPTAIIKFLEYVDDQIVASDPFEERAITLDVSFPINPCARPVFARSCNPRPVPTPYIVFIPLVNSDNGILAKATAFVHSDGEASKLFNDVLDTVVFQPELPFAKDEQPINPAP
jgi:hypothetical protein